MTLPVSIVVAAADNDVIGRDNRLIWRLRTDLRHFRELTIGRPLVMGRKTFLSIGAPLPGRESIVVTRDPGFAPDGVRVAGSVDEALALAQEVGARMGADSVAIGGGGEIYAQTMAIADRIHLTRVHVAPEGETVFPRIDPAAFREVRREAHPAGPSDDHPFTFIDYERR
ncbi:dihydrofolate reductase [uncultured Alsobacter sp.]|uniref:dihydrofolate reductase n=1 Tax=uncultured Alsobacter sp. TaxID=1748258 RepID=UPI0025E11263|nr:dihydrofolate reductase [uncultured Alsobacter sp.]